MRLLAWLLLRCVLFTACLIPREAQSFVRATVDGKPGVFLYWPSRTVDYYINKRGSADVALPEVVSAIKQSFFQWSSPACTDLIFHYDGLTTTSETNLTLPASRQPDYINVIRWREDKWPPDGVQDTEVTPDMLALTVLIFSTRTGVILDADMELNGVDWQWTTTDNAVEAQTDIRNVVTHEAGHVIGLAHSLDIEATMHAQQGQGELSKRNLHPDDLDALCLIYPFEKPTPLGAGQPALPYELIGGSGCTVSSRAAASGWGGGLALVGLLLAVAARRRRRH